MGIGDNIRQRRRELHLTLEDVASKVGISRQTMSRYETGIISNIPSDKIEAIASALSTSPSWLMGWRDELTSDSYPYVAEAKQYIILLVAVMLKIPPEAVKIENDVISVAKEYENQLDSNWVYTSKIIRHLIEVNFPSYVHDIKELDLLSLFFMLNEDGKDKLLERAEELAEHPKYRIDDVAPETPPKGEE